VSWLDRIRAALGRERDEAADVLDDARARLEADLARREAELAETPTEKLARITEEIEHGPDPLDEVRARIEAMGAAGAATGDPGSTTRPGPEHATGDDAGPTAS